MERASLCMPAVRTVQALAAGLLGGTALLFVGVPGASASQSSPCSAAARACVDLSAQQAWLTQDGAVVYGPVPVATGMDSAPTDTGTFHVTWKDLHHRSTEFNDAPMPYSVFFNGGEAFHQDSVVDPSNGCVHLTHAAARTFYNTLQVGDVVQVVN